MTRYHPNSQKNLETIQDSSSPVPKNRLLRRLLVFLLTVVACSITIFTLLFATSDSSVQPQQTAEVILRPISVIAVEPATYHSHITAYGEVVPEWEVELKSKVQGEILTVADSFRKGNRVSKGDALLSVEPTEYRAQLTEAKLALVDARTKLLVEEKEGQDALAAWKRSGLSNLPTSPLLLREPYLEMARANLISAQNKVAQAQLLMEYTTVKAPFDGLVVERAISPGTTVFPGDTVGTLYGVDAFIVALHISNKEWEKLPLRWQGIAVRLFDEATGISWQGSLERESKVFDRDSRLRTLFVKIHNPLQLSPPLLPGNFLRVEIPGKSVEGLLRLPDSALTRQGLVWYVDSEGLLQSIQATPLFREKGYLYFRPKSSVSETKVAVAVTPNNSFVNGLRVTRVMKEN